MSMYYKRLVEAYKTPTIKFVERFNWPSNYKDIIQKSNNSHDNTIISRINYLTNPTKYGMLYQKNSDCLTYNKMVLLQQDYKHFIDNYLDNMKQPVTIIIIDHPFSSVCYSVNNYNNFLNHSKIRKIYSENWFDTLHPKLQIIPIGLEGKSIIDGNINKLYNVMKYQKLIQDKPLKILCNAHLLIHENPKSGSYNQRQEVLDKLINNELVDFWNNKVDRELTWKLHDNYSFELCPEGNGLDTHRFYEALLLNTIPIVKRNSLESMYKHFPCVIVDDWNEITKDNCVKWKRQLSDRIQSEKHKLKIDYWIR